MELETCQTYLRSDCAVFFRTAEQFGGLSNMAGGYPLFINGIRILTSEALYQACRFPHLPDIQKLILGQTSPMAAKMKSKPYRKDSRPDWDDVRVYVMRWCLHVKLAQNWEKFGNLLLSTGNMPIVEESYRDPFWGAKPIDQQSLVGQNVLGQLLVELREKLKTPQAHTLCMIEPLPISQFLLINKPIGSIENPKARLHAVSTNANSDLGLWQSVVTTENDEVTAPYNDNKNAIEANVLSTNSISDSSAYEADKFERLEKAFSVESAEVNQPSLPLSLDELDKVDELHKKAEMQKSNAKPLGKKNRGTSIYMQPLL